MAPPLHPRKRAPHRKGRTGCVTCKIRRLRCDEQKPQCLRCVSTGRKCDGYTSPAAKSPSAVAPADARHPLEGEAKAAVPRLAASPRPNPSALLPRYSPQELRSYRYFHDMTIPSCSGVFSFDFWARELPQACHTSPAIWHAVVSLGAIHECYSAPAAFALPRDALATKDRLALFGLEQFNLSIRRLVQSPPSADSEKVCAAVCSIVFTFVCTLQGLQDQAVLHLRAGKRLLEELEPKKKLKSPGTMSAVSMPIRASSPVTFANLNELVIILDIQATAIQNGGLSSDFHRLGDSDSFSAWRFFTTPSSPGIRAGEPLAATAKNLVRAGRAAESLLNAMVAYSQQRAADLAAIILENDVSRLEGLVKGQEQFGRAYAQLKAAVQCFTSGAGFNWNASAPAVTPNQRKGTLTLMLYLAMIRVLMYRDPEGSDATGSRDIRAEFSKIVDVGEEVLRGSASSPEDSSFLPTPSPTQPLFLVAHSGLPQSTRRRAVEVLRRYPRREGLWDSSYMAALADCILRRDSADGEPSPMTRIHDMRIKFDGERRAKLILRTWDEWAQGGEGTEEFMQW